jgi:hypothetical protein
VSTSVKPDNLRFTRKWLEPEVPPVLRRGREHRIVRWIGAGNRRSAKPVAAEVSEAPEAADVLENCVIRLSWADTFGRPARRDPAGYGLSAPIDAQVLRFQSRPSSEAARPAPRRAAAQPAVPVLR